MIVLDLSILNQKGTPMFNSDTFANRPAFGIVGRIFISTDTKEFFRDTGTSWELIGGPGSGTITGSGAPTQIAFWNSASTITGSNNLWYDSTNSYLGVNTNAPGNPLDVHGNLSSVAALNQTTATNNTLLSLLNSGTPLWRIGNFYTAGANDFGVFDVVNTTQQLTIVKATGQTFIGAKTTASGRLVVNSATADNHLQIVGANSPSIRIDNAGSGGTQRFVFGLATATNNFIQGATAGEFCISTQSAGNMLFGMWQTTNASEVMRITTTNNLLIGSSVDGGQRLQVAGKVNSTGYFLNGMTAGNGALYWSSDRVTLANYNVGGILYFEVNGGIPAATIIANGNLGLGTNAPVLKLDVTFSSAGDGIRSYNTLNTGFADVRVGNNTNNNLAFLRVGGSAIGDYTSDSLVIGTGGGYDIKFAPQNTLQATLKANGNLLINTTTDNGAKLQVNGLFTLSATSTPEILITDTGSGRTCLIANDSSNAFFRTANGNNFLFQVSGGLTALTIKSTRVINITAIPTTSVGLVSGDIYSNAGILTIVP